MSWAFIDDQANEHDKQVAIGGAACWYWTCGLMYCRRKENERRARRERLDFIPEASALVLYPDPKARRHVAELVRVNLWEVVDGGYLVHDYADVYGKGSRCASRAMRALVVARDGLMCALCGAPVAPEELAIDHAIPWSKGGPTEPWNLRVAHGACNSARGARS